MAPAVKLDPNELVRVNFIDTTGVRHNDVAMPRHMISGGSVAAKERWLISHGEIADPSAPLVELQESAEIVSAVIDTAALSAVEARIQALEQRPEAQELPTHDSLERLAISVQRAAISKAEIVAVADEATARIDAVASDIEVRQNGFAALIDGGMRQMADAISSFMEKGSVYFADLGQNFALFLDEQGQVVVRVATDVATKVATAVARAEAAKHWGSSVTIAAELPTETGPQSWAKRWYGRDFLIPGDGALAETPNSLRTFRFTGRGWVEGGTIEPKVVAADVKVSALDASTKVTSLQTISGSGGGGGGGEHLLVNRIGVRTSIAVADSSNWAGVSDVTSGQIVAELTALDGGLRGNTYLVLIPFTWSPAGDQFTVDGELGGLTGLYDINVSVQRSPAVTPAVFTGTMPPGSNRTVVFLSVVPSPGGGGDTTSFRLGGDIEWAHIAQGAAVSLQSGGLQPLWIWS